MFTRITYEGLKMLSNLAVKVGKLKLLALNLLLITLRNKAAHVFEVCCSLVNDVLAPSVARSLLVKVSGIRQRKRSPDICACDVVPQSNVSQRDFMPQRGLVGGLAWRQELERDFREAAESNGKKLRGLGGIIPVG